MERQRSCTFEDRRRINEEAWKSLHGFQTTSGCPCWDRSTNICIPKHSGYGYNFNFWCLFCCFLCQEVEKPPSEPHPVMH